MSDAYQKLSVPKTSGLQTEFYYNGRETNAPARVYPPHVHDCLEIYVLEEGDVSFIVETNSYKLTRGDAIVCKPNEIHNCILNADGKHAHYCFWFDVTDEFFFSELLSRKFGRDNLVSLPKEKKERLLAVCKDLYEEKSDRKRFYRALEFIDLLQEKNESFERQEAVPPILKKILEDANERFTEIPSLTYFTEKYFVSASTLNRLFKKYLNVSPNLYLETKRLAYSRKLLREGKSVFDACMQSGFSDYSNYIRLFKKRFGATPKHYKETERFRLDDRSEVSRNIYF